MSFPFPRPFPGPSMVSWGVLSLFSSGEQGAWYDPSDFSTMFQDSAGITPVTAVEQPVGLLLDKSKGLALGSERTTNGGFDSTAWWGVDAGWSISGGVATNTGADQIYTPLTTIEANKRYEISFDVTSVTTSGALVVVVGVTNVSLTVASTGRYTLRAADATGGRLRFGSGTGHSWRGSIDNVSIKEVQGNHARQSTAASRPVLSARVNLLTYSEQFDNAAWTKQNVTVASNSVVAPDGATTADTLTDNATSGRHATVQAVTVASGVSYTVTGRFKAGTGSFAFLCLSDAGAAAYTAVLNMADGTISQTRSAGVTGASSSVAVLSGGWYLVTITCNAPASTSYVYAGMAGAATGNTFDSAGVPTYSGSGSTIYIWGADARVTNVGVNLPAYQRVGAATDYDTSGFPLYLKFDGVDDSLATGTIDPGAVDKAQVFAGVRKLSDAGDQAALETTAAASANNGAISLFAPVSAGANYNFGSRGTTFRSTTAGSLAAPITTVVTGLSDISGDSVVIRANGVQASANALDQGTGNYASAIMYIGRRAGTTLPFNGQVYSMIVRFSAANLSDAQIASTETYVNNLTKAY